MAVGGALPGAAAHHAGGPLPLSALPAGMMHGNTKTGDRLKADRPFWFWSTASFFARLIALLGGFLVVMTAEGSAHVHRLRPMDGVAENPQHMRILETGIGLVAGLEIGPPCPRRGASSSRAEYSPPRNQPVKTTSSAGARQRIRRTFLRFPAQSRAARLRQSGWPGFVHHTRSKIAVTPAQGAGGAHQQAEGFGCNGRSASRSGPCPAARGRPPCGQSHPVRGPMRAVPPTTS